MLNEEINFSANIFGKFFMDYINFCLNNPKPKHFLNIYYEDDRIKSLLTRIHKEEQDILEDNYKQITTYGIMDMNKEFQLWILYIRQYADFLEQIDCCLYYEYDDEVDDNIIRYQNTNNHKILIIKRKDHECTIKIERTNVPSLSGSSIIDYLDNKDPDIIIVTITLKSIINQGRDTEYKFLLDENVEDTLSKKSISDQFTFNLVRRLINKDIVENYIYIINNTLEKYV